MKRQPKSYVFYMGILIFAVGLILNFLIPESSGALRSVPFLLTGFGAGIIGVGVVNLIRKKMLDNNPEKAKQYEIEEKDERNIRLREKAGYATWYTSLFMLAILSLTFIVLDYKIPCFIALGALMIHIVSLFVYIHIYNRKI